jgi:UDP-glucose 4-epimerase
MTILVTGGAGYIGSQMVYQLADSGERMVVLDDLSTGFDRAVAPGVPLIVADIGDGSLLAAIIIEHGSLTLFISPPPSWSPSRWPIRFTIIVTIPPIPAP